MTFDNKPKNAQVRIVQPSGFVEIAYQKPTLQRIVSKGGSMKAEGLNEVFFATIVFGLNGYFIANVYGNEGRNHSHTTIHLNNTHEQQNMKRKQTESEKLNKRATTKK